MRRFVGALGALVFCAVGSGRAQASGLEFNLSQLGSPVDPGSDQNNGLYVATPENPKDKAYVKYDPHAQERYARFVTDLAFAITPLPSGLSSTAGDAGLDASVSIDVAFTNPHQKFSDGTVQSVWPTVKTAPTSLTLTTLHLRKGLPMSIQVGTDVSYVTGSSLFVPTVWVQWSPLEGLKKIPDLSIRGLGSVLLGGGDLMLVVGGWDVGTSYRIPIRGVAELGLYAGYQQLGISASTQNIDFMPDKENAKEPLSDDSVFAPLSYGNPFSPTTRLWRFYFGAQVRASIAVFGFDAAYGGANNAIGDGYTTKYSLNTWKIGFRGGVQF